MRRLLLVATGPGAIAWPGHLACLRRVLAPGGWQSAIEDGAAVQALFGGRRADECEAVARALSCSTAPTRRGYATQLFALAGFSSLTWLHRLWLPTLILAGDDDRLLPLANARLLATLIPRAELVVLRGAGHWLLLERLDEACARIESFTKGCA